MDRIFYDNEIHRKMAMARKRIYSIRLIVRTNRQTDGLISAFMEVTITAVVALGHRAPETRRAAVVVSSIHQLFGYSNQYDADDSLGIPYCYKEIEFTYKLNKPETIQRVGFNPLDSKGNYSATSNNTLAVDGWAVTFGTAWAGCGTVQSPHRCTKCNSPPINGQCTNHCIAI